MGGRLLAIPGWENPGPEGTGIGGSPGGGSASGRLKGVNLVRGVGESLVVETAVHDVLPEVVEPLETGEGDPHVLHVGGGVEHEEVLPMGVVPGPAYLMALVFGADHSYDALCQLSVLQLHYRMPQVPDLGFSGVVCDLRGSGGVVLRQGLLNSKI